MPNTTKAVSYEISYIYEIYDHFYFIVQKTGQYLTSQVLRGRATCKSMAIAAFPAGFLCKPTSML